MSRRPESAYDVIVAGGGAGGIGAALGAAMSGSRVLLVEKYGFLGGAATASQVLAYCGFFQQSRDPIPAVAGAGTVVLDELASLGLDTAAFRNEITGNWIIRLDPEVVKYALDRVLRKFGIDVLLHTRVAAATVTAESIESITLAGMEGRRRVEAEAFVDATGDGNLALVSGLFFRVGNSDGALQAASAPIRIGGIRGDIKINRNEIVECFKKYNAAGSPYPMLRNDGGIYTRVPGSDDVWWMAIDFSMPDLSSESFTKAEQFARAAAHEYVAALRQSVSGFEKAYLISTGPQIGIRESRHPEARYEMTRDDLASGRLRPDGVARAAWPMEDHGCAGKATYHPIGGSGYAHIPLDALRAKRLGNLWLAGRVIGADAMAFASIRVMGTAFASGEAAGTAAALRISDGERLQGILKSRNCII